MNVLIAGKGSYIGTKVRGYIENSTDWSVDELDLREPWENIDLSNIDVVYFVAGIAHVKETKKNRDLYQKVNCNLAIDFAKKCKQEGIKKFVFMSSMSVYGLNQSKDLITATTVENPVSLYGISKLNAESGLVEMADADFAVVITRPPMVYGDESPGNMSKLLKAVQAIRIFPNFYNERSSISIDVLVSHIMDLISNGTSGVYIPQNEEFNCTYKVVKEYMNQNDLKFVSARIFNPLIRLFIGRIGIFSKVFGDLRYDKKYLFKNFS